MKSIHSSRRTESVLQASSSLGLNVLSLALGYPAGRKEGGARPGSEILPILTPKKSFVVVGLFVFYISQKISGSQTSGCSPLGLTDPAALGRIHYGSQEEVGLG